MSLSSPRWTSLLVIAVRTLDEGGEDLVHLALVLLLAVAKLLALADLAIEAHAQGQRRGRSFTNGE